MKTTWFIGCKTEEDRDARRSLVDSSTPVLDVLRDLLEKRKRELTTVREEDYNVAGWPYLAAHRNGRLEELDRLINLLGSDHNYE